jgi:hypothetical protein
MLSRGAAGLLLVAVTTAACGQNPIDVDAPRVAEARAAAETDIRTILASVQGAGTEYGRGRTDSCSVGQDNWSVTDPYEFFCGKEEVVVIGLGKARDADQAVRLADEALADACPESPRGRLADNQAGLDGLRAGRDAAATLGYRCGALYVGAYVLRAKDGPRASELSRLAFAVQRVIENEPLDGPAAVRRAAESGEGYVLALYVQALYFQQPRE